MSEVLKLGIVQIASSVEVTANLDKVRDAMLSLQERCDLAVFPENALCLGHCKTMASNAIALADWSAELGAVCREFELSAVFGGVPVTDGERVVNASLVFDRTGELLARYDKMHLFQLDPGTENEIDETRHYTAGQTPASFDHLGWRVGLSVCYDLRFPELFRTYFSADLLVCTAAFTSKTGIPHWEPLLRARAIENQCYVAGVGQCGENPETGIEYHGHSIVVDPWGTPGGGMAGRGEALAVVELTKARIAEVRNILPAMRQQRFHITVR